MLVMAQHVRALAGHAHVDLLRVNDSTWSPHVSPGFSTADSIVASESCFATYTWHCQTWPSICFVLIFGEQVHRNMKHQCSMRRLTITGGSEKDVRVSWRMDCRFGVIKSHVSAKNKNLYIAWLMCHVYKFMCYSFVDLKLKINTR